MLPEDTHTYFKLLNDHFSKKIAVVGASFKIDFETFSHHLFAHTKSHLPKAFVSKKLLLDEQEVLSVYLSWIFNQLLCISVNDKNRICVKENIELQKEITLVAFKKQRWWFTELIASYTSLLKQSIAYEDGINTELQTKFCWQPESIQKIPIALQFHKVVLTNRNQCDNLIHTCISLLIYAVPQYCNLKKELGICARDAVLEVFRRQTLVNKKLCLVFFHKYFKHLVEIDAEFFISIMHSLSIVFKDLSAGQHDRKTLEEMKISVEMFFEEAPISRINFENQLLLHRLVTHTSEILFHQMGLVKEFWFNPEVLSNMLMAALDQIQHKPEVVSQLKNLLDFDHPAVLILMKYLIVAEIESNPKFDKRLAAISPTWNSIHERLMKKIEELQSATYEMFQIQLAYISECFLLAVQVEFDIIRRHQLIHGACYHLPCFCSSLSNLEDSQESLFQFKDWNYKHIKMDLFDDLVNIAQKLIAEIDKHNDINGGIILCYIDIFSCILRFSTNTSMDETMKLVLFSVIASPFYKCLKEHPQFGRLGGFKKVMTLLPIKFKSFFEKPLDNVHSHKLQCDSIVQLSQVEISRISNTCWWLIDNIIQYSAAKTELTSTLFKWLTSFFVNNSDRFQSCVDIYNKMLFDMNNPCATIEPLHNILCLTDSNVLIFKVPAKENTFQHFIVCDTCELKSTIFPKISTGNEAARRMGFLKSMRVLLVSPDRIKEEKKSLSLDVLKLFDQSNEFKIDLIEKLPAMLNHSLDFKAFVQHDKGKNFFEQIFVKDEKNLEQLEANLKFIFLNILKTDFSDQLKKEILNNCFSQISSVAKFTAYGTDKTLQLLTVNITFTYSTTVVNENNMAKCFKIFLLYIVQNNSQIMGEASTLALQMAQTNGISLHQLFSWHKTFIMRHVVQLAMTNFFISKSSLVSTFANLTKRLNFQKLRDFAVLTLDTIVADVLPMAMDSKTLLESLKELCNVVNQPLPEAIVGNFMKIYLEIYTNQTPELRLKCLKFIEETTETSITKLLTDNRKKTVEEAMVYYNKSQAFVIEVMNKILGNQSTDVDPDLYLLEEVAEDIKKRFLGVLIYFEPFLTSNVCERVIKKNILLSLGDIIRLLSSDRVSGFCFKIITILKAAVEQTSVDLSEISIKIWGILIRNCDVMSLAPILSTIFVSLEFFIDKYPEEVNDLYKYLVVENRNMLSRNISDLFFIEKTRVDGSIKAIVTRQMESQKVKDNVNFKSRLESLCRQMNSENSDLKIRVYCLQYLKELFQKNRNELNELICGQMTMDPLIEDILHILVNNCKNTSSEMLQLATAECLGELGAIEPSLQQQNFSSRQEFPKTIHSEEFAKMALAQLCRSYQYKNDAKYIDALSLAIQQILQSPEVNVNGQVKNDVWLSIPERMRPLMKPLLTSSYSPREAKIPTEGPIFWISAQTVLDWAYKWSGELIHTIQNADTKYMLECIKPSMKHNQFTTSMFLPYILLHNLELSHTSSCELIKEEIQLIFDIVMEKDVFERESEYRMITLVKSFDFKPLQMPGSKEKTSDNGINAVAIKVSKLIFDIFDFLENYRRTNPDSTVNERINELLDSFDIEEMAHVNFKCGEYARAMIYLETKMKQIRANQDEFQSKLPFLTNVYAKLENPDLVEGVQALMTSEWSLEEKILISNVTGNFQDSAACFERMMQVGHTKFEHIQSIMNSYISLDQPETALLVYENMIKKLDNAQNKVCNAIKAEPLWRLSRFDELCVLLSEKSVQTSTNWGVRCGQLMLTFRAEYGNFKEELCNTRLALMKNLKISGSEQTAYGKNYREIINLHLISEFEKAEAALVEISTKKSVKEASEIVKKLMTEWSLRMEFVQKNVTIEEPIFCFHRIILNETKSKLQKIFPESQLSSLNSLIDGEIGNLWIKSTRLACKNRMYQQAQIYILNAEHYQPKGLFIEKAKLHWIKNDQNNAFKVLDLGTKKILEGNTVEDLSKEEKEVYSKGKLMIACYNAEAVNLDFKSNRKLFCDSIVKGAENEKNYLIAAEYMDRFYCTEDGNQIARVGEPNDMRTVMKFYYRSMYHGSEFVFQSMPRFLSIWFDTTALNCNKSQYKAELMQINSDVDAMVKQLDMYYFYSAFSQLISRLCHPSVDAFNVLKTILVNLILKYPQQSLWFLIPMLKSSDTQRVKKCKEVLTDTRISDKQELIKEFNSLVDKFVKLATVQVKENSRNITVDSYVPELISLLNLKRSPIIMPFHCNLQLIRACKQNSFKFADKLVNIHSIKNLVEIMCSLQRPRKVTLIGDDGRLYVMLLKQKDDLRIDLRVSEFSNVLKEFLHKDPESRFRQLTTRTYSVIPLNENAGLIEWVPNLRTYKDIIMKEYEKKKHKPLGQARIQDLQMDKMKKADQIAKFRQLKTLFYPALGDYFRQQFATPQNYYKARSSFIRTTSTMSIIGYILGLGDRHGENILLDVRSGETFHVDFNMLFNRGETLQVPETVPFRLTHNMIDAMGVLGIEGPFRINCETILRVLQKEKNTLMSYLRPLVYDPLLKNNESWKKNTDGKRGDKERVEEDAIKQIKKIEMRLNGIVSKYKGSSGIPLSTEGQVNFIIGEATNEENLAAMFRGWMPWL